MKVLTKILQHPLMQILGYPLSWIFFGLALAISQKGQVDWRSFSLLILVSILIHSLNHYHYYRLVRRYSKVSSPIIYWILLIGLLASTLLLMMTQHYLINLMLIIVISVSLVQFEIIAIVGTFYHPLLNIYFYGFLMNVIAYYSQAKTLNIHILSAFTPLLLLMAGIELNAQFLKGISPQLLRRMAPSSKTSLIAFFLIMAGAGLGVFLSLPTQSYFIPQILFFLIILFLSLPTLVPVKDFRRIQNKLNYQAALALLFAFFYSLSYLL